MRFLFGLLAICLMGGFSSPSYALTDKQHGEIARLALVNHIRPSYAALGLAANELEKATQSFCKVPTSATQSRVEQQFEKLLLTWSRIDHIRFGPINKQHRLERFSHWPDHKSIGLRQVKRVLQKQDASVLSLERLQQKSIALQGLTALEVLLFGKGRESLLAQGEEGRFRCNFALTISKNLSVIAAQVEREWQEDSDYIKHFLHPNEKSEIFMEPVEVTRSLFMSFLTEVKVVHLLKLGRPLGKSAETARPRRAAFWRSGLTFKVMDANLDGIRSLFNRVFSDLVSNTDPGVEEGVELDFEQVHRDLSSFKTPIAKAVVDKSLRAKLKNLNRLVDQIKRDAGTAIIKGAELSIGFNALDGD